MNQFLFVIIVVSALLFSFQKEAKVEDCKLEFPPALFRKSDSLSMFKVLTTNCEIDSFRINVYDKFGKEVFKSKAADFEWSVNLLEDYYTGVSLSYVYRVKFRLKGDWEEATGNLAVR